MTDTRFTPGPWYAIPHAEWSGACYRIDNNPKARWGHFNQIAYARKANAHLIAAAPELYEALKKLVMNRHIHVSNQKDDECHFCGLDLRNPIHYRAGESFKQDIADAETILAKARGES